MRQPIKSWMKDVNSFLIFTSLWNTAVLHIACPLSNYINKFFRSNWKIIIKMYTLWTKFLNRLFKVYFLCKVLLHDVLSKILCEQIMYVRLASSDTTGTCGYMHPLRNFLWKIMHDLQLHFPLILTDGHRLDLIIYSYQIKTELFPFKYIIYKKHRL
jgi:hypothetical protein